MKWKHTCPSPRIRSAAVMVLVAIITLLAAVQIRSHLRLETNLDAYMPADHPAFVYSDQADEWFGIQDAVVVVLHHPEGIYRPETMQKLVDLTRRLQELPEIRPDDVKSLATADNIVGSEYGLDVRPFFRKVPGTPAEMGALRREVDGNEMVNGRLVSKDGTTALIMAEMDSEDFSQDLYDRLLALQLEFEGPEEIHIAGQPVVEGTLALLAPEDMKRMVPIVVAVIALVLLLSLRSLRSTVIILLVVLLSTIWTFGLMAALRVPMYSVSTMIPVMLIAIGVADGIHMLSHLDLHLREHPDIGPIEAIRDMTGQMKTPVIMTAATTAVGFLALITSQVYPVKYFGLFTAFGVLAAMVLSLLFLPASLHLVGLPRRKRAEMPEKDGSPRGDVDGSAREGGIARRTADRVLRHRGAVALFWLAVGLISVLGARRIWVDSSFLAKFGQESPIVEADAFINGQFGGTSTLNVIFQGEDEVFKDPLVWERIQDLQEDLEDREVVGDTFSLADYLSRMHMVMNEDRLSYNVIPDSRELIAQYLLLYSMSGDPEELDRVVDYGYRRANLRVQLKGDNTRVIEAAMSVVEEHRDRFPGLEIHYAGSAYKSFIFSDLILEGQIGSLVLSIVIIVLMLALMFRSLLAGVIGSLPVVLTIFISFGVMGYLGIPLNSTTAMLASIAVGIGIDYAIHFMDRFRRRMRVHGDLQRAARETMTHSGRAIAFNAITVIAGFAVLLFSVFPPNRELGALVALNMFDAFAATLTLVLAMLALKRLRFLTRTTSSVEGDVR